MLLRRAPDGTYSVAVSDPTTRQRMVSVTIRGRTLRPRAADEGVRIHPVRGGTRIDVTTHHAYGRSFTATLRQVPRAQETSRAERPREYYPGSE
ncbi:hypothetical protein NKH18_50930 [Streptomyces sp. M10(2022)]